MIRPGVYVDLATNHPVVISNTFFLDRCLGWKGLCIEPNPVHHSRIRQARSCSLVDKVMTGPFSPHTVTMTSTVGGRDELGGRTHVGSPTPKDRSRYPRHKLPHGDSLDLSFPVRQCRMSRRLGTSVAAKTNIRPLF